MRRRRAIILCDRADVLSFKALLDLLHGRYTYAMSNASYADFLYEKIIHGLHKGNYPDDLLVNRIVNSERYNIAKLLLNKECKGKTIVG